MRPLASALALVALSSCLMMPPPQAGGGASSSLESSAASPTGASAMTEPGAAPTSEPEQGKAPVPTSIQVHSDCPQTTPLFIGDKPKYGSGTKTSIGSNTTTTFPRRADGTQTIWIIDASENGVASVNVTPETKRVEIDRGCKDISAR